MLLIFIDSSVPLFLTHFWPTPPRTPVKYFLWLKKEFQGATALQRCKYFYEGLAEDCVMFFEVLQSENMDICSQF